MAVVLAEWPVEGEGGSLVMLPEWPRHDSAGRRVKCLFGRPTKGLSKLIEVLKVTQIPLNIPKKGLEEGGREGGRLFKVEFLFMSFSDITKVN